MKDMEGCACSGRSLSRLVRPALLALLSRGEGHGYALVQRLGEVDIFSDSPPNTSGVYKVLKSMQQEGLVTAAWDTSDDGPAKRRYTITAKGKACLERWAKTLGDYRRQVEGLLSLIDG